MDYQTYGTKHDAAAHISTMHGWEARPEQLYLPDHPQADSEGNVWVIVCVIGNGPAMGYLRTDGFVR